MASHITMWGRNRHQESLDALKFLKAQGYGVDRLLDLERQPPDSDDLDLLRKHLGGTLAPLLDREHPDASDLIAEADEPAIKAAVLANALLLKAPILDTPKGAVGGFREQRWRRFLGIGGDLPD